jgi:hypothetical protein
MGKDKKQKRSRGEGEVDVASLMTYTPHKKTVAMTPEKVEKYRKKKKITITSDDVQFYPITSFKRTTIAKDL